MLCSCAKDGFKVNNTGTRSLNGLNNGFTNPGGKLW